MVFLLTKDLEIYLYPVFIIPIAYQWSCYKFSKNYLLVLSLVAVLAWVLESLEALLGLLVIKNHAPLAPLWLILLWMTFVSVTFFVLGPYLNRPWKSFLYGVYSLPGSYYLVEQFEIVDFGEPLALAFVINGAIGGMVLWVFHKMFYSKFVQNELTA